MTEQERRGLELLMRHPPLIGGYGDAALKALRAALAWIDRQLEIDFRRRAKRGKYIGKPR